MPESKPSDIKCSRQYWTHGVIGPYTLKAEQRLDVLVSFDRRLTPAAGVVFRFLLSWDMEEHGNALASVDFISAALKAQDPTGVGLSSSAVGAALKLLRETGWITQTHRGTGPKNASRYQPAWNALMLASDGRFPSIVTNRPHVVDGLEPSTHSGQYRPHIVDASTENRPHVGDKDSLTDAPKEARTVSNVSASGMALEGPAAAGGFEQVWKAYGKYGSKVESRKAFEAIAEPDVELIAARAASWCASAKPGKKRMPLEKWLASEKYDEADRTVSARPTKPKPVQSTTVTRPVVQIVTISNAVETRSGQRSELRICADDFEHTITLESPAEREQEDGQNELRRIVDAAGIDGEIQSASELVGRTVEVTWFGEKPVFSRSERLETKPADVVTVAPAPEPPPRTPKPKPKLVRKEIGRDEELRRLREWIDDGLFDDEAEAA